MASSHWLVILSGFVSIAGASTYIRDTLAGKTKPNVVSWSMWAFAPLVGTAAAISLQADVWATSRIFLAGFLPLVVVVASLASPKSYWRLTLFDFLCGACSVLALLLWALFGFAQQAILLAVLGDAFAALPTIKKAWGNPQTETGLTYIASLLATILVLPSIPQWDVKNAAFQIYLLLVNTLLIFTIYRPRKKIHKLKPLN